MGNTPWQLQTGVTQLQLTWLSSPVEDVDVHEVLEVCAQFAAVQSVAFVGEADRLVLPVCPVHTVIVQRQSKRVWQILVYQCLSAEKTLISILPVVFFFHIPVPLCCWAMRSVNFLVQFCFSKKGNECICICEHQITLLIQVTNCTILGKSGLRLLVQKYNRVSCSPFCSAHPGRRIQCSWCRRRPSTAASHCNRSPVRWAMSGWTAQ